MRNELNKALSHESKRVIVDSSKLESWLDKLDNTYVQSVCYACGNEQQASVSTLVSHTHVKCAKCGAILFLLKPRNYEHVEGPRVVEEQSSDICATCDIILGTCDTIWAAEGSLYCSAECGVHDAVKRFYAYAEEINPQDIGLEPTACEWCGEVHDNSDLHKTDLGWLCDTCISAIRSRGEEVIEYGN